MSENPSGCVMGVGEKERRWFHNLAWHAFHFFSLDDEARGVFSKMSSQASGEERAVHGGLLHNAWFYLRAINFGAWPYALAYPLALVAGFLAARTVDDRRRLRLTVVYPLGVFLFFCIVSKFYPWYIVPAYPFMSIWLGAWIARCWTGKNVSILASSVPSLVKPCGTFGGMTIVWSAVTSAISSRIRVTEPKPKSKDLISPSILHFLISNNYYY